MFTATLPKRERNNRNEQTNEQHKRRQKTTSLTKTIKRWVLNTQANTHTPIIQTHGKSKVYSNEEEKRNTRYNGPNKCEEKRLTTKRKAYTVSFNPRWWTSNVEFFSQ